MKIMNKLASALGRRDEVPNQELAREIAKSKDTKAIKELVDNLGNKDKSIQFDCIKVLYEIGEHHPELISDYDKQFLALLDSKHNRLVWGAMTALDYIASVNPKDIHKTLGKILAVADKGTVITKDHAVNILITLAGHKKYTEQALTLLLDQFRTSATNQLPMYAERSAAVITGSYRDRFGDVLRLRLKDIERESGRKRIEKVIRKLSKPS